MPYFDSHAHYNDARFAAEYPGGAPAALAAARDAGVEYIVNVGTNPQTSRESLALADTYSFVYAAAGLHPTDALDIPDERLNDVFDDLRTLLLHPKCRAHGEIGLDYHWDPHGAERQKHIFDVQLSIAEETGLPAVIHDRDAHGDCFDILRAHPNVRGILHSFSGSAEMARQLAARGWYISFSGPITYKNAHKVREAAAAVPHELLLIETDSPYLPPVPHRGELNYSGYLPFIAAALADAAGLTPEEAADITYRNAQTVFGIH